MFLRWIFNALIAIGLTVGMSEARASSPKIVVSIKPVHSLVAGVMGVTSEPYLVVKGTGSPHTQVLRPSAAKALSDADLVFWIGPQLERFLEKPLATLAARSRVVTLAREPNLNLLPFRASHHSNSDHGHYGGESLDPHLWLDPRNATSIVDIVVRELGTLDPGHASRYRDNGHRLVRRIEKLDRDLRRSLGPLSSRPFVVYHDAFGYFVRAYGLTAAGFVTLTPERPPGARHLRDLRETMGRFGVHCVFREPGVEPRVLKVLREGLDVRIGVLDPLGIQLEPGPDLYFHMMRNNARALVDCLRMPGHG